MTPKDYALFFRNESDKIRLFMLLNKDLSQTKLNVNFNNEKSSKRKGSSNATLFKKNEQESYKNQFRPILRLENTNSNRESNNITTDIIAEFCESEMSSPLLKQERKVRLLVSK